ncbi:MAG: purine-cytosine permease family protein [Sulfobacillus sp.]
MTEPARDNLFTVEPFGRDSVPQDARRGSLREVFWIWFAANLAITAVVVGAVISSYGLAWWQSLVALSGLFSYLLVGYFSIPGCRTGRPTMVLSASSFGEIGNTFPSLLSWLNLVGWETVVLVIATDALEAAVQAAFGIPGGTGPIIGSLVAVTLLAFSVAFLGHRAIVRVQTWFSYLFGALTLGALVFWSPHVHWAQLAATRPGPWLTGVLPAFSIVVAVSGLSWVNTASDYSRYLPAQTSGRHLTWVTTWASVIPAFGLTAFGVLLATGLPGLASSANPIALLESALPAWLGIPYLLTAVGGMVTGDIMDVYSSGMSLLAARVRLPRSRTVFVDGVISIAASLYILLEAHSFVGTFEAFLTLLGGALAPWAAIFWLDLAAGRIGKLPQARTRMPALISWVIGVLAAVAFTSSGIFSGPLATGVFAGSSLGLILSFVLTLALYPLLRRVWTDPKPAA